ncbi:MAG: PKD domain-containing protein, partial [Chloroflexia bacterium]
MCQVYAEDATNPANNDTSQIVKHLIAGYFDPAGWQLEPITGASVHQWAAGVVGTNPAAAGPVGYVVGGLTSTSALNPDLQMYDPNTGTWTQLADLPNPRFSPVAGWIGGLLYAAGGYDAGFAATSDLQVYNPATDAWDNTTPTDMPNPRGGGAGGVGTCASGIGECLFHVGGGPDGQFANTTLETWQYDPGSNAWTQLDNKPAGSSPNGFILGAGVGCLGHIYVGGDYRGFHEFYRLDATQPSGSQWTQLANIPAMAGAMTPALICKEDWGKIVLLGGDPDGYWGTYNNTVYVYDIASDTWEGPLPQTLNVGQLGSVGWHMDDKVWTVGGTVGFGPISPMPFESLRQVICGPCAWKEAPATAGHGQVISYTITIAAPALVPGMFMTDVLPLEVEYAGNLTWTAGYAWYDANDNAVYWTMPPLRAAAPAPQRPTFYYPSEVADRVGSPEPAAPAPEGPVTLWNAPEAVLWDNGSLVTHPGGGYNGADASALQSALGMNTYGFGHQFIYGYRMSDQFTITNPLGWDIDTITFFAYQTGAPTDSSTITGLYFQIWDGPPWAGGSVIWGDLTTNRLVSSAWSGIYRSIDTNLLANIRPIMANVGAVGITLPPGTYWLDWMTDGSLSSGPWAPPITILGQTTTGDAYQYTTAWGPALDTGTNTQQGMPFIIEGTIPGGEQVQITFDVTVTAYCGALIINEGVAGDGSTVVPFGVQTQVVDDPMIAVEPPALWAEVCPDSTGVLTFTICNEGCLLTWELREMTRTLAGSMPFVPVKVEGAGINPGLTAASPAAAPVAVPAANPEAVLWDQPLSAVNQAAYVDQEFTDYPAYSSFLADDFSNADPWVIESIFVPGNGWNGFTSLLTFDALTWQIYADCAGVPCGDPSGGGSPPVWTLSLAPNDPQVVITNGSGGMPSDTTLNLAAPVVVPPGTWWFIFYPTGAFGTVGQYGRQPADTTNGYTGQFINPGGGFGYGTTWQPWTVIGPTQQDITFRLEGQIVAVDVPWLSEDPTGGIVPPGECATIAVTFDATGMAPGDYLAALLIQSNDPDTPEVTIPVTMTVLEPAAIVNVDYGIDGLTVAFTSTVSGAEPIDYLWDLGDGNTSTDPNPIHTYAEGGCYTVTLDVANACGQDSWSGQVCVCDPVHDADFSWSPLAPLVNETVYFTGTAAGTGPITYDWDLGDGGTGNGPNPTHVYAAAGTYTVIMTATGQCGDPVSVSHDITVYEGCIPPSGADFTWTPLTPTVGQSV